MPAGSISTLNPARKVNLLNLTNGVLEDLGQTSLPAGHYTQLRLELAANSGTNFANSVVLASDPNKEIALDTPSAVQSGIKLVNEFDVAPGQHVDLVLDFDALKSVVARGNGTYSLKPVIRVVPTELNGIAGFVDTAILGDDVRVSAQTNGKVICSTTPNPQTGEFFLARLAPGNYDVVLTGKGRATVVIAGVPVATTVSTTIVKYQHLANHAADFHDKKCQRNGHVKSPEHNGSGLHGSQTGVRRRPDCNGCGQSRRSQFRRLRIDVASRCAVAGSIRYRYSADCAVRTGCGCRQIHPRGFCGGLQDTASEPGCFRRCHSGFYFGALMPHAGRIQTRPPAPRGACLNNAAGISP